MERGKAWTAEEEAYLQEHWGSVSLASLAKHLGRTENAVLVHKDRLHLGPALMGGEYVSVNQASLTFTGHAFSAYFKKSWIENRGFPVHYKQVRRCRFMVVYMDEFWKWAEQNRSFLDFSLLKPLALGPEPDWVAVQRRKDRAAFAIQRKDPWTTKEDARLCKLLKCHEYTWLQISQMMQRSCGAIQRRCIDLGIKDRPVRECPADGSWLAQDYAALEDGIKNGDSYMMIGERIGKSEKAVRGKVYYTYRTEKADKVRAMMGDGHWGDGAAPPTVKQALKLSNYRTETKKEIAALVEALNLRAKQLRQTDAKWAEFWQHEMCMNWNDLKGCTAGCDSCDDCAEFRRIPPQYCKRCGGTFYERRENDFCLACRFQRKKQAQRKYAVLASRKAG